MLYQQQNFVGNTSTYLLLLSGTHLSTLELPIHLRTSYYNFCSISKHHPGQREHYGKDHPSSPRKLHLILAAVKVMKKRYKMWHLEVQEGWIGMGWLTVVQVLEKMAKL